MAQPPSSTSFQPRLPTAATTAPAASTTPAPTTSSATSTATPQYYPQHPLIRPPIQFTTTPGPPLTPRPSTTSTANSSTGRPTTTSTLGTTSSSVRPAAPTTSFVSNVASAKQVKKVPALKGTFVKDLRPMMHAFGDHPNPAPDTVSVMEEILMDYMTDVVGLTT
ncbi:hypothetical protein FRC12_003299 [Ceratobasidium sp. 428]|nr:hypothetical protein FRC12_003299 [Ceratobasidium sp. 428]